MLQRLHIRRKIELSAHDLGFEVDFIIGDHTAVEVKAKKNLFPDDIKSLRRNCQFAVVDIDLLNRVLANTFLNANASGIRSWRPRRKKRTRPNDHKYKTLVVYYNGLNCVLIFCLPASRPHSLEPSAHFLFMFYNLR